MFLERSNTDSSSGLERRRDTRSSIRKRDLTSSEQLRIIENHNHTVNFPIPQDNPSLQSMQTNYRSMQNVQAEHAPSLQSMYSAQTSFDKNPTRDVSQNLNMSDKKKESLQSLRNNICMDDYSPHSSIRLRKTSCSNPSQSLSKLSVNSSVSKPDTPTTEPGTRPMPFSISQSLSRSPGPTLVSPGPGSTSKCQNMHCSSSQGYQLSQLSQHDLPPSLHHSNSGFSGYQEQLQNPFSPEDHNESPKVPFTDISGSSCKAQPSSSQLSQPSPSPTRKSSIKSAQSSQHTPLGASQSSQHTPLEASQGSIKAKTNSDTK